jgi:hypothetical protein
VPRAPRARAPASRAGTSSTRRMFTSVRSVPKRARARLSDRLAARGRPGSRPRRSVLRRRPCGSPRIRAAPPRPRGLAGIGGGLRLGQDCAVREKASGSAALQPARRSRSKSAWSRAGRRLERDIGVREGDRCRPPARHRPDAQPPPPRPSAARAGPDPRGSLPRRAGPPRARRRGSSRAAGLSARAGVEAGAALVRHEAQREGRQHRPRRRDREHKLHARGRGGRAAPVRWCACRPRCRRWR